MQRDGGGSVRTHDPPVDRDRLARYVVGQTGAKELSHLRAALVRFTHRFTVICTRTSHSALNETGDLNETGELNETGRHQVIAPSGHSHRDGSEWRRCDPRHNASLHGSDRVQ
jgi:hypothetical protein